MEVSKRILSEMATSFLLLFVLVCRLATASYLLKDIPKCEYTELPCDSGQCVDRKSWCDGRSDCYDDSDEKYCRTTDPATRDKGPSNINGCDLDRYFECQSGMCIPKAGRCNDMPDCPDREDEENCDYLYESDDTSEPTTTTRQPSTTTTTTTSIPTTSSTAKPTSLPEASLPPLHFLSRGDIPAWMPTRQDVLHKSVRHVMEGRDSTWGWGELTSRVAAAIYLANQSYFDTYDGILTKKQLEVQLALALMRSTDRPLRVPDLAHYVHALIVTCIEPRDFYGVNVLRMLRKAVSRRLSKGLFVPPLAYLAMCNAREPLPESYKRRLKNMAYRRSDEPRWLDVQTFALLAISCLTSTMDDDDDDLLVLKKEVARNVSEWQQEDGGFGTVHSTGLALQALIAASEPGTETSKGSAMTHLLLSQDWQGSYGNELDNYYVLPALNLLSLASLHARTCTQTPPHDTQSTEGFRAAHPHSKSPVDVPTGTTGPTQVIHFSLWLEPGIQTVSVRVPRHANFLKVMDAAQALNPHFKHEVLLSSRSTSVHSIGGHSSDIEKNTYWTLYRKVPLPFRPKLANVTATVAKLKLLGAKRWTKDLRKLHPRDGEHLAFWYKSFL